jgi:glycosyltransferase involved in cell wall biosynthesis
MLSICIPSYNYGHYLPFAVESCLAQDEDFELVVLDNCSKDDTPALRDKYARDPRVKWHRNDAVLPVQDNFNRAISLASREFTMALCADDALVPGSIRRFREMIRARPHVCFHGFLAQVIDQDGRVLRHHRKFSRRLAVAEPAPAAALKGKLRQQIRFREPSCNFYRKSSWEAVGGYRATYKFSVDLYFNLRMLHQFPAALWNEHLVQLRRHVASVGAKLPGDLALADLRGVIGEILTRLGDEATMTDRAAGDGWVIYRLVELVAQRFRREPRAALALVANNLGLLARNPLAYFYTARLLKNRLLYQDVQQQL